MNSATISGRVVSEPTIYINDDGTKICILRVRTQVFYDSNCYNDVIKVKATGKDADYCEREITTGDEVIVYGRLKCRVVKNKHEEFFYDTYIGCNVIQRLER